MGCLTITFPSCSSVSWPEAAEIYYYMTKQQIRAHPLANQFTGILYKSGRMLEKADQVLHSSSFGAFISLMFE